MPNFVEGDHWSKNELARAAALFRGSSESLLGIFKLEPAEAQRARWRKCCESWACGSLMMPCMAPCICWLFHEHKAVMAETLVVVTDRTLYRDVNGPAPVMQHQAQLSSRLDGTLCEGLSEPPTGGYSGRLPLDRVQSMVSSVDPQTVVRLDGAEASQEHGAKPKAGSCSCVASPCCPTYYITITMAPHGVQLNVFLNSEDELERAMALLKQQVAAARAGEPTRSETVERARRRKLSMVPMEPLVMERNAEDADANARYSRRDAQPPPRRKASVTWSDGHGTILARFSRVSNTVASLVRVSRASRTSASRGSDRQIDVDPDAVEKEHEEDEEHEEDPETLPTMAPSRPLPPPTVAGLDRSGSSLRSA